MTEKTNNSKSYKVVVAALYKFVHLPDYKKWQFLLSNHCKKNRIKGTILIAEEGINGTVAGSRKSIDSLMKFIHSNQAFYGLEYKESYAQKMPFLRMKVRLKKEIITMGVSGVNPSRLTGTHVGPEQWNDLISDPDVLVIDTRNRYECKVGTFKNAITPDMDSFREFPEYAESNLNPQKHKKIAMFCTGGIRCEKATSFMLGQGYKDVYQLNGGILRYLEEVDPKENKWEGECFVFDGRVAVNDRLKPGEYEQCFACRMPLSTEELKSEEYEPGISCPHCYNKMTTEKRARFKQRQLQIELAKKRNEPHLGKEYKTRSNIKS